MYKDEQELPYRVFRVIFGSDILTYDLVFALIYRKPNNDVVTFVFKYGQVPVQQLQETQSAHILVIKKKRYLAALIIHVLKERKSSGMIRMKSYPTFNWCVVTKPDKILNILQYE